MNVQLESRHFFRSGDLVEDPKGRIGRVVYSQALYAMILWPNDQTQEVDQFDPAILVLERAETDD